MARQPKSFFPDPIAQDERFYNSMLNSGHAWISGQDYYPDGDYITLDLGDIYNVCGFATKGREGYILANTDYNYITQYRITYSTDNINYTDIRDTNNVLVEFPGNNMNQHELNNNGKSFWGLASNYLLNSVSARYVRFF